MPRRTRWSGLTGRKEKEAILKEVARWVSRHGGDALTFRRLHADLDLSHERVFRHWPSMVDLRSELGLPRRKPRKRLVSDDELLDALHDVATRFGRFPKRSELDRHGAFCAQTYYGRFGSIDSVRVAYDAWLKAGGHEPPGDLDDPTGPVIDDVLDAWQNFRVGFVVRTTQYRDGELLRKFTHDFIVCVDHDWPGCPLPVVTLPELGWRFDRRARANSEGKAAIDG